MAGLDHAVKLRRGIGKGQVVDAEELTRRLAKYDGDGDGNITREELKTFFVENRCGGPWFCATLANTMFANGEMLWATDVDHISSEILGRVINHAMSLPARATKRYLLTPEAVQGLEPKRDLKGNVVESSEVATQVAAPSASPSTAAPRVRPQAAAPRPPGPRPRGRPGGRRAGPRGPRRK